MSLLSCLADPPSSRRRRRRQDTSANSFPRDLSPGLCPALSCPILSCLCKNNKKKIKKKTRHAVPIPLSLLLSLFSPPLVRIVSSRIPHPKTRSAQLSSDVIPAASRAGTPAPAAAAALAAVARTAGNTTTTATTTTRAGPRGVSLARRRAHKGKVDAHRLVQQLGAVGAVDGGAGLLERRVLDQRVALLFFFFFRSAEVMSATYIRIHIHITHASKQASKQARTLT